MSDADLLADTTAYAARLRKGALAALRGGRPGAAERRLQAALAIEGGQRPAGFANLAQLHEKTDALALAASLYRRALLREPANIAVRAALAGLLVRRNEAEAAWSVAAPLAGEARLTPAQRRIACLSAILAGHTDAGEDLLRSPEVGEPDSDLLKLIAAAHAAAGRQPQAVALMRDFQPAFRVAIEKDQAMARLAQQLRNWMDANRAGPQVQETEWSGRALLAAERHLKRGALDAARQICAVIRELIPANSRALDLEGRILVARGDTRLLRAWAQRFAEAPLKHAQDWNNVAIALKEAGLLEEAVSVWRQAVVRFPDSPQINYNLGNTLVNLEQAEEAEAYLLRAVTLRPRYFKAWNGLAAGLCMMRRLEESEEAASIAIALEPNRGSPRINRAMTYRGRGDLKRTIAEFRDALKVDPGNPTVAYNLAFVLCMNGEIEEGLGHYTVRWDSAQFPSPKRNFPQPQWQGQPIPDGALLVYMEQGMGDEFTFSWVLPLIRRQVDALFVECDARLLATFRRSFPTIEFRPRDFANPHPDLLQPAIRQQSAIGDTLRFFAFETRQAIKRGAPLTAHGLLRMPARIAVDPARAAHWRRYLSALPGSGPRVGLCWRSAIHNRFRDIQYLTLEEIADAVAPGAVVVNLQYSWTPEEIAELTRLGAARGFSVANPPEIDLREDLDDVLALMSALDLVVSPLISNAWMGGALGIPTWVLRTNEFPALWLQFGMPNIPWYPSMRLFFRRSTQEPWNVATAPLKTAMQDYIAGRLLPVVEPPGPDFPSAPFT